MRESAVRLLRLKRSPEGARALARCANAMSVLSVSALMVGCAAEEPVPHTPGVPSSSADPTSHGAAAALDGASEQALKVAAIGPQPGDGARVLQRVDWSAAAAAPRVSGTLGGTWAEAAGRSDVPVLLPESPEALSATRSLIAGDGWYTAQISSEGIHIGLFGTRVAERWPVDIPDDLRIREGQPQITRSEGIPSIAFTRFGVSYMLDIECDAGPDDPRCATFDTLHEVYNALAVAGPARLGAEGGEGGVLDAPALDGEVAP